MIFQHLSRKILNNCMWHLLSFDSSFIKIQWELRRQKIINCILFHLNHLLLRLNYCHNKRYADNPHPHPSTPPPKPFKIGQIGFLVQMMRNVLKPVKKQFSDFCDFFFFWGEKIRFQIFWSHLVSFIQFVKRIENWR